MKVAVLTGGGDCPGLNAVLRALVKQCVSDGHSVVGFRDGWRGAFDAHAMDLGLDEVRGILPLGGTILGSSGVPPHEVEQRIDSVRASLVQVGADALVVIGGEGSIGGALVAQRAGIPVVAVPKTIDNDLGGTDSTFGFDTAVNVATEAIDRLYTTAESHHRIFVVEVMGRNAGWIALNAGLAGGANGICIPEVPFSLAQVEGWVNSRFAASHAAIIVVAERAVPDDDDVMEQYSITDEFGARYIPDVGSWLARALQSRTGHEARSTVLGHIQRGGTPSAYDRVLATRFGLAAARAVTHGQWGVMVALQGNDIAQVAIADAVGSLRRVPRERYDEAALLFG